LVARSTITIVSFAARMSTSASSAAWAAVASTIQEPLASRALKLNGNGAPSSPVRFTANAP